MEEIEICFAFILQHSRIYACTRFTENLETNMLMADSLHLCMKGSSTLVPVLPRSDHLCEKNGGRKGVGTRLLENAH